MTRYWVIAPYSSASLDIFDKVWEYDRNNGTIAVGWKELGDVSKLSRPELEKLYKNTYPNRPQSVVTREVRALWEFHKEISIGDRIIARQGRKKIIGIGEVVGESYYSEEQGRKRVANLTDDYYPNFIRVDWEQKGIKFKKSEFSFFTLYEISEEKYKSLLEGEGEVEKERRFEFALEEQLEDFMVSNFDTIFGGNYKLYVDSEGREGQQYPTEIGDIDILAKEKEGNNYVVIELKKGKASDTVVGQTLRYMGWVKENLCKGEEDVKGLVVCRDRDEKLEHALRVINNVEPKYYKVDFELTDSPTP